MTSDKFYREIDVTIFSATDLRDVRIFGGKMSPYVVGWVHNNLTVSSSMDKRGSVDPKWNDKLRILCDEGLFQQDNIVINLELFDGSSSHSDPKKIGGVAFHLSEVPGDKPQSKAPMEEAVFMSLPVVRPSAREQGTLNFSVKIGDVTTESVVHEAHDEYLTSDYPVRRSDSTMDVGCCGLPNLHQRVDDGGARNVYAH